MLRYFPLVTVCLLFVSPIIADDAAAPSDPVGTFKKDLATWETLNAELKDLNEKYRAAQPTDREPIKEQHSKKLAEINEHLETLRKSTLAAYEAAPNKDETVTKTLVGILGHCVGNDLFTSATEIANVLKKHPCDIPVSKSYEGQVAYTNNDFEDAMKLLTDAKKSGSLDQMSQIYLEDAETAIKLWEEEKKLREAEAKADDLPRVKLETTQGDVVIELYENEAPDTVGNFVNLVESNFYDGIKFHRVIQGFVAQAGCPVGDGSGGPGYNIYCECTKPPYRKHFFGTLSMAKQQPVNTGGSQFFLTFRRTDHLDGKHTVFGRVIEGMDVLEKLQRDPNNFGGPPADTIKKATVIRKRDHEYKPNKVS